MTMSLRSSDVVPRMDHLPQSSTSIRIQENQFNEINILNIQSSVDHAEKRINKPTIVINKLLSTEEASKSQEVKKPVSSTTP